MLCAGAQVGDEAVLQYSAPLPLTARKK